MMKHLRKIEDQGDYLGVIKEVRERVSADRRAFTEPHVKAWCGRRFRNLFLQEAVRDQAALAVASRGRDKRPAAQRIAERFMKGDQLAEWKIEMPEAQGGEVKNTTLLFCPGLLTGLLPVQAFKEELSELERTRGWRVLRADAHPMRSCEANIADLHDAFERGLGLAADASFVEPARAEKPGDVFVIGYSKGAVDLLTYLVAHPEVKSRVRCFFSWAGAIGGSFTAESIHEDIRDLDMGAATARLDTVLRRISPHVVLEGKLRRLDQYDIKGALLSLCPSRREAFMKEHGETLDAFDIPFFNLTGATTPLEVPYFQLADAIKLGKYDANNDMQLTQQQARVHLPMATDLAMFHGHHWDLSYGPFPKAMQLGSSNLDHPFPRKAAVVAMVKLASELGLLD
jgi:hypothetical protein